MSDMTALGGMAVAIFSSDTIVLGGMVVAIAAGIHGLKRGHNRFCRAGSVFSAVSACVGLAYFGYRPFFGGTHHDIGTSSAASPSLSASLPGCSSWPSMTR